MSRKNHGGRPTKLTDEVQRAICRGIRMGNYIETAALLAGVSKQTFYTWVKKGHAEREAGRNGKYARFLDAVEKAQAEAEALDLAIITKAAREGQWQAAAWRLERKFPDRWGRRKYEVEHTGKDGGPVQVEFVAEWGGDEVQD